MLNFCFVFGLPFDLVLLNTIFIMNIKQGYHKMKTCKHNIQTIKYPLPYALQSE